MDSSNTCNQLEEYVLNEMLDELIETIVKARLAALYLQTMYNYELFRCCVYSHNKCISLTENERRICLYIC